MIVLAVTFLFPGGPHSATLVYKTISVQINTVQSWICDPSDIFLSMTQGFAENFRIVFVEGQFGLLQVANSDRMGCKRF